MVPLASKPNNSNISPSGLWASASEKGSSPPSRLLWVSPQTRRTSASARIPPRTVRSRLTAPSYVVGSPAAHALLRVRKPPAGRGRRHPRHQVRVRHHRRRGQADRRGHRRSHGHQVPGALRRPHEGGRREVRRHARGGRRPRPRHPQAGDQRPHAPRRAGGSQGRGQAGVLRRRGVGRHRQEAADPVQRHGRHRHRAGRRGPPRPRRARPRVQPQARSPTTRPSRSSPPPA